MKSDILGLRGIGRGAYCLRLLRPRRQRTDSICLSPANSVVRGVVVETNVHTTVAMPNVPVSGGWFDLRPRRAPESVSVDASTRGTFQTGCWFSDRDLRCSACDETDEAASRFRRGGMSCMCGRPHALAALPSECQAHTTSRGQRHASAFTALLETDLLRAFWRDALPPLSLYVQYERKSPETEALPHTNRNIEPNPPTVYLLARRGFQQKTAPHPSSQKDEN